MLAGKIIFTLDCIDTEIQCTKEKKMKDICQKFASKRDININSLIFLYNGNIINFELSFQEQANSLDKSKNEMKILVYTKEYDKYICPKCNKKQINLKDLDEIIISNNEIKEKVNGVKFMIENMIKNSFIEAMNSQLKNINIILNTINEDIKKNNDKIKNVLNDYILNKDLRNKDVNVNNINQFNNNIKNNINFNNANLMNNNINYMNNSFNNSNNFNFNQNMNFNLNNSMNNINNFSNMNQFSNNLPINKIQNNMNIIESLPNKTGLKKIGNLSNINAIIQSLINLDKLSNYLMPIFNQNNISIQQQPLSYSFASLLFEFKTTNQCYIIPKNFIATLEELNPLLIKGNDPLQETKNSLGFIIVKFHQELKPQYINQNNFPRMDFYQQELESRNQMLTLNKFLNEFQANKSIISDIFYGITQAITKCNFCMVAKYSFKSFNFIDLELKKIYEEKKQELGEFFPNNYIINLYDGLYNIFKRENFYGENQLYCNNCRTKTDSWIKQSIYQLPKILIFILDRGKNNKEFNEVFNIDETIDFNNLQNIMCNIDNHKINKKYFLCGIITIVGKIGVNHNFICYFRKSLNQRFYCYKNEKVIDVSIEDAMKIKISRNKEEENIIPFILFYHYKK